MNEQQATLLDQDNPLLEALGKYVSYDRWPEVLERDPLDGIEFAALNEEQMDTYIELAQLRFAATTMAVEVASSLQTMIRASYSLRNPTLGAARKRLAAIAANRGRPTAKAPVGAPLVYGKLIMGITGTGKSVMVERALSTLPRICVHERSDAAGWIQHVQIPYLVVQMTANRGGLLYAILQAIDEVAETDYRKAYVSRSTWTIDKLFVEVAAILALHSVGLLVIEEIQVRNFALSPHREDLLLFFLRLLNYGIPVVLIGNPLGFEQLDDFSQDVRRLTRSEPVELMPASSVDDEDWDQGIAPALWAYGSSKKSAAYADVRSDLWRSSGGIPDFAATTASSTLRIACRTGARSIEDLRAFVAESPRLKRNRDLIDGFANKDPRKLSRYLDVPWEEYAVRWGADLRDILSSNSDVGHDSLAALSSEETKALIGIHARLRARHQREQTQRKHRQFKDAAARAAAGLNDLRREDEAAKFLAKSMDQLRTELDADSGRARARANAG